MTDLYIRSISGTEEMLTDFEVSRKDGVNGDKLIDVKVIKTETNEHAYSLVYNQNIFIYEDDEYIIKNFNERTIGNTVVRTCKAIHRMFEDLTDNYIYDQISGTFRLDKILEFALKGTGYRIVIYNNQLPLSVEVENFGDDNSLALMKKILEKFGAEFEVKGNEITITKEIGAYTDEQFRYYFNIKEPSQDIDTNSFATYIKGYGKPNEDGSYVVTAEYTSSLAKVYGIKHAKPVRDERYTDYDSLKQRIIRELHDSIDISVQLTAIEAEELGWQYINKGDYVWCIIDPFDLDVRIRVVEVEDFSNGNKSSIYTLGQIRRKTSDIMVDLKASQQAAKKEIGDTKVTVIQTKQAVEQVRQDVSTTTGGLQEIKASIETTNRNVSEQSGDIRTLKQTVSKLETSVGGIEIPVIPGVATEKNDGLMSAADKKKLNQIKYTGQAEVDLSILVQKISSLEQGTLTITQQLQKIDDRVKVLEGNKTV
ncbi:phage tail protein [Bacillus cereus group sp. IBL03679]|uniref:phage tail protein n=1 Tax=Bacillus cereus group sp. IBL03679 TaxID=3240095 RepID=UPI003D2F5D53